MALFGRSRLKTVGTARRFGKDRAIRWTGDCDGPGREESPATGPPRYDPGMKVKTSVTLDGRVVAAVDAASAEGESRSQAIERLLRQSLAATERAAVDKRDRGLIDLHAEQLNDEALDVLAYQADQ